MLAYIAESTITLINIPEKLPSFVSEDQTRRVGESTDLVRQIAAETQMPLFSITTPLRDMHGNRLGLGQKISGDPFTIFSGDSLHPAFRRPACRHVFLGGLWLDEDVLIAALAAQMEGFDTRVLIDLSIARDEFCRSSAIRRLNQHGILLTTARQTVCEWALTADDPKVRDKLKALLIGHPVKTAVG